MLSWPWLNNDFSCKGFSVTLSKTSFRGLCFLLAIAAISLAVTGCGSQDGSSTSSLDVKLLAKDAGVYDSRVADFHGLGPHLLGFSFSETTPEQGGIRIVHAGRKGLRHGQYKANYTLTSLVSTPSGLLVTAEADLGADLGRAILQGTLNERTFTYTLKDALGTTSGVAVHQAPFFSAKSPSSQQQVRVGSLSADLPLPTTSTGTWTLDLGAPPVPLTGSDAAGYPTTSIAPLAGYRTRVPVIISSIGPDGFGALELSGTVGGPQPYLLSNGPYAFNGQFALKISNGWIWGATTSISIVEIIDPNLGTFKQLDVTINGWDPANGNDSAIFSRDEDGSYIPAVTYQIEIMTSPAGDGASYRGIGKSFGP